MASKKPQLAKSELVAELPVACATEAAAVEFLERKRWAGGACCPLCGSVSVYQMKNRAGVRSSRFLWRCRDCDKMYTVRTGTVYAESLIPLHKWLRAMWEAASAKNCVSALEMSRKLELSYKSTLFLMHRIRHAMADGPDAPKLEGTIEADETYVGGKPRIPYKASKNKRTMQRLTRKKWSDKTPVFAVIQRGGEVRARVMANVTASNVRDALIESADTSCRLMTDQALVYINVGKPFAKHDRVNHTIKEYVNRNDPTIHTNGIESFFARVKRGINGTYHAVSKEHLHRYVDGFAFLYNTRELNDGERTLELLRRVEGKRLMYKQTA